MSEKLQKANFLARVGLGSRRYMEEVIAAGRVSINGKLLKWVNVLNLQMNLHRWS